MLANPLTLSLMDIVNFLIQLLNSVQYGLLLFMLAAGLTLIFGIMGVVNLAHGSFYMIGAYVAFSLAPYLGQHFIVMLLVGVVLARIIVEFYGGSLSISGGSTPGFVVRLPAAT